MEQHDSLNPSLQINLNALPVDEWEELLAETGEHLFSRVIQRVWYTLDYTAQDKLLGLFEASTEDSESTEKQEAIFSFLAEHVPDFDRFVNEEAATLRRVYEEVHTEVAG
ncbi:MAG: hypothetical protein KBD21_05435 [Candidatus Pacebacteria bacterium]|nr:hypothetical protein [Candidatus Paceibacterota bacterium]